MTTAASLAVRIIGPHQGPMLHIMGTRNEVKLTGADTGGRLSMFEFTAGPGDGIPLHVHTREDEIFYVLEGEIEFTAGEQTSVGGPGTVAFLPVSIPHAWKVAGDRPARGLLMTTPGTFDAFFAEMATPPGEKRPMDEVIATCRRYGIEFLL